MALTKKTVGLIVVLIAASLAGLVVIQIVLLGSSLALKEQTFRREVLNTMMTVAEALEAWETARIAFEIAGTTSDGKDVAVLAQVIRNTGPDSSGLVGVFNCLDSLLPSVQKTEGGLIYCLPSPQHVKLELLDSGGVIDTTLVDRFSGAGVYRLFCDDKLDSNRYSIRLITDSTVKVVQSKDLTALVDYQVVMADSVKGDFASRVLQRLRDLEWRPFEQRLDSNVLDSILANQLTGAGFDQQYVYGVVEDRSDSLLLGPDEYANELLSSEFRARLFPHDIFAPRFDLLLHFPEGKGYIWKQMSPMLVSMIAFLLIIIYCFVYTIRTIIVQRRNAALMVDFVNNMTHEFKTPISTVTLACEAILRPDVLADGKRVSKYSTLIRDENRRMRSQTEKILQMAALEEGDLRLKYADVDLHELIRDAVDNIALQVESKGGGITCSLEAENHVVRVDRVHLSNILHNLLDNANKYSPENPSISVLTWNGNHGVYVRIEDRGKGISEEHLKHIFKKYFRVPTGNIHDVKGFGLGLSYVKLMVEAHGGNVSVRSKPGKGTQVDVFLPMS